MDPRIHEIIAHSVFHQKPFLEISELLPEDDATLNEWIAEAVRERDEDSFVYLVLTALYKERRVETRHLSGGLGLLPDYDTLGMVVSRVIGEDVPEQLLAGVKGMAMNMRMTAAALLIAGSWYMEKRDGRVPDELRTLARLEARRKTEDATVCGLLGALAQRIEDDDLLAIVFSKQASQEEKEAIFKVARDFGDLYLRHVQERSILSRVPENPVRKKSGFTVRRSVSHIGRNEPCPCGSGQKYKRCCLQKDEERLLLSTNVTGKTRAEIQASPEAYLTEERIQKMRPAELAHLDVMKIDPALHVPYFLQMSGLSMVEEAVTAFGKLGFSDERLELWSFLMSICAYRERRDMAERLLEIAGEAAPPLKQLKPSAQFLLASDDPGKVLATMEELALEALKSEDNAWILEMVYGFLFTSWRALAILIARGVLPLVEKKEALQLLEQILVNRDRLNLSHDDPAADFLDQRFAEAEVSASDKNSEALREAQRKLELKVAEVQRMKQGMEELRKEIEKREQKLSKALAKTPTVDAGREAHSLRSALHELREKMGVMKSNLKERHEERTSLRRELESALTELEKMKEHQKESEQATASGNDPEEDLIIEARIEGNQPVRILQFPAKFHDTLSQLPRVISRKAMVLLGRLASGEPDAFAGVVRLKASHSTLRLRVGSDYRLLFQLQPECVQVIDLINRRDLDRRIRTL